MPTSTTTATATTTGGVTSPTPAKTTAAQQQPTNFIIPGSSTATGNETIFNLPSGTNPYTYPGGLPQGTGGPNDANYTRPSNGGTADNSGNIGMIVGITVAGVAVLAMVGLLLQRYRSTSRTNTLNSHQTRSRPKHSQTGAANHHGVNNMNMSDEERGGDRAQLAKSFTIRKPPSVYVDDDQDLDQTGHPRYKSDSDARNHPYYGDRSPGLIEYELSDTSGQKYGPSSVAERKRYVEQQQRKVMDEYEMFNPHRDQAASPYPASQSSAPSYMTNAPLSPTMAPSMGGRSPRVQNPSQVHSPFGRPLQDDYKY
ncbi:hypothetical protein CPB97_006093 [Podila verticillata]|nr:hypothetical protein CPB97_006093 [Podila verticillata]